MKVAVASGLYAYCALGACPLWCSRRPYSKGGKCQLSEPNEHLLLLGDITKRAQFNNWLGLEVVSASLGNVELHLKWREEFGQYTGYLHAGIVGALIDTACGFAAATVSGRVLASQYAVRCLRPAIAETFVARGKVIKPGRQQIFTASELFGLKDGPEVPFAVGDAILVPVQEAASTPAERAL